MTTETTRQARQKIGERKGRRKGRNEREKEKAKSKIKNHEYQTTMSAIHKGEIVKKVRVDVITLLILGAPRACNHRTGGGDDKSTPNTMARGKSRTIERHQELCVIKGTLP